MLDDDNYILRLLRDQALVGFDDYHQSKLKRRREFLKKLDQELDEKLIRDDEQWEDLDGKLFCDEIRQRDIKLNKMLNSQQYSEEQVRECMKEVSYKLGFPVLLIGQKKIEEIEYEYLVLQVDKKPDHYRDKGKDKPPGYDVGYFHLLASMHFGDHTDTALSERASFSNLKKARRLSKTLRKCGKQSVVVLGLKNKPYDEEVGFTLTQRITLAYMSVFNLFGTFLALPPKEFYEKNETLNFEEALEVLKWSVLAKEDKENIDGIIQTNLPDFPDLSREESIKISRALLSIIPPNQEYNGYEIDPLYMETSSLCVGKANGLIFKVSDKKRIIEKEALIIEKLSQHPVLQSRIVHLYDSSNLRTCSAFSNGFKLSNCDRYLTNGDLHILLTYVEGYTHKTTGFHPGLNFFYDFDDQPTLDYGPKRFTMNDKVSPRERFDPIIGWNLEEKRKYQKENPNKRPKSSINETKQRLITLGFLHGAGKDLFTDDELVIIDDIDDRYHDFSREKIESVASDLLNCKVLDQYEKVSKRQRQLYEQRRKNNDLFLTHGDAKWDNWVEDIILTDFGSSKLQTEYKDVAKALLDSTHIFDEKIMRDYLLVYMQFQFEGRGRKPCRELFDSVKKNVYDAILTESIRTIYYKHQIPGKEFIVKDLVKIANYYSQKIADMEKGDE